MIAERTADKVTADQLRRDAYLPALRGVAPELDQAGLVGVQRQPEALEPLAQVVEELLCVTEVLETAGEVVREAHDDVAACLRPSPAAGPPVEDIVEVHVREQRRGRRPCGAPSGVSDQLPSSMTPAFNHLRTRRSTRRSAILRPRNLSSQQ